MKFAHELTAALENYPAAWAQAAIPYGHLKKVLGRVRRELLKRGYDRDTLRVLLQEHIAEYRVPRPALGLEPEDARGVAHPKLFVRAPAAPASVARLITDVAESSETPETASPETGSTAESESEFVIGPDLELSGASLTWRDQACGVDVGEVAGEQQQQQQRQEAEDGTEPDRVCCSGPEQWVVVPLKADDEFFDTLEANVKKLDALHGGEQHSMQSEIARLGGEVAALSRPSRWAKSDLYRWREIFQLYLDADIFFSTVEAEPGAHDARKAHERLVWFQNEVAKRAILGKFKLPASMNAYKTFLELNARTLRNVQFQELNRTAINKIIKKFDKQTSLQVSKSLSGPVRRSRFIAGNVARDVCAELDQNVLARVPQMVDNLCPVCQEICWVPIRLKCQHLFCVRCMVSMQKQGKNACALCRAPTVLDATTLNMDEERIKYLETWFRKEVREKQIQNEIERGKDLFGPDYKRSECVIM